jgi:SAM-dependent methyltransferase
MIVEAATDNPLPEITDLHTDPEKYEAGMGGWSKTLAPLFIEFIGGLKDGDAVLDVGCGTGSLTFAIADTTKASKIVGIDPSKGYLEYARVRNSYPYVAFELGDAQKLPFDDESFDCCVSALMIQFVSDARMAVREMSRVTRRGGVVAACVWDNSGGMELSRKFWDAAAAVDPGAKRPGHSRYGSPDALAELWKVGGFVQVQTTSLVIPIRFSSFENFWRRHSNSQGPAKPYLSSLSDERRQRLKERLRMNLLADDPDGTIELSAKAWAVRGIVPQDRLQKFS